MNDSLPLRAPLSRTYGWAGVVILAAWGLLIVWQRSAYAGLLGHELLGDHHISFALKLSAFLLSWLLMTLAMMLPASLPALLHTARAGQGRPLLAGLILGYLGPWMLFGLLAFLGDGVLHERVESSAVWAASAGWFAPAAALGAGLYQLSPIKRRALQRCQPAGSAFSPLERDSPALAIGKGVQLGAACVGSCWALMLLMLALGTHHLGWMLAMGLVLAAERQGRWGRQVGRLAGALLLVSAFVWLLGGYLGIFGHIHL